MSISVGGISSISGPDTNGIQNIEQPNPSRARHGAFDALMSAPSPALNSAIATAHGALSAAPLPIPMKGVMWAADAVTHFLGLSS